MLFLRRSDRMVVTEAFQWWLSVKRTDIVRPFEASDEECERCHKEMAVHGWLVNGTGSKSFLKCDLVCPGDWVYTHGTRWYRIPDYYWKFQFMPDDGGRPDFEQFGQRVWSWIKLKKRHIFEFQDSHDLLIKAKECGLPVILVEYDPEKHGAIEGVKLGESILWFL
jgi:hypothetical protein